MTMEYEERSEELERQADQMEQQSERVGGKIKEAQEDWEAKMKDQQIPGAMPAEGAEEEDEDDDEGGGGSGADDAEEDESPRSGDKPEAGE